MKMTKKQFEQVEEKQLKPYYTENLSLFAVNRTEPKEGVVSPKQLAILIEKLNANEQKNLETVPVRVIWEDTGKQISKKDYQYYYGGTFAKNGYRPATGQKFEFIDGRGVLLFNALMSYNNNQGLVTGFTRRLPFNIVYLEGNNNESLYEAKATSYNTSLKNIGLGSSLTMYSSINNTNNASQTRIYRNFKNIVLAYVNAMYGTTTYTSRDVETVLCAAGIWSKKLLSEFKKGNFSGINPVKTTAVLNTLVSHTNDLVSIAKTRIDPTKSSYTCSMARWIFLHSDSGGTFTLNWKKVINHCTNYPNDALDDTIGLNGQAIFGYYKRIMLGKINEVYNEIP